MVSFGYIVDWSHPTFGIRLLTSQEVDLRIEALRHVIFAGIERSLPSFHNVFDIFSVNQGLIVAAVVLP